MAEVVDTRANDEDLRALERFVAENDDLLELEERIGRFNIFDALGIARAEIRHSNFLAWLLDPAESHGQGDLFLKAVLMDVLRCAPLDRRVLSPVDLDGVELRDVEVRREWRHIDLLIASGDPAFVVAIENKVGSSEHGDQLARYQAAVRTDFGDRPAMFVYLTPDGDDPTDAAWVPYSYRDLLQVLSRVRRAYRPSIGQEVATFLDHYVSLLGSRFMEDSEIIALCRRIYKNHRQALDLIFNTVQIGGNGVIERLGEVVAANPGRWVITRQRKNELRFTPVHWSVLLPPIEHTRRTDRSNWIACYLWFKDGYLEFSIWVLRTTDPGVRQAVLDRLTRDPAEFGFAMPRSRRRQNDEWTPILEEKIAEWAPDDEPDLDAIASGTEAALSRLWNNMPRIDAAIREALAAPG